MFDLEKQLCNWPAMVAGCPPGSASDNGIGESHGIARHYALCGDSLRSDIFIEMYFLFQLSNLILIILTGNFLSVWFTFCPIYGHCILPREPAYE